MTSVESFDGMGLRYWFDFPNLEVPRPLVLVDARVHLGASGFTDGAAKLAWLDGAIDATVPLPDGLLDTILQGRTPRHGPNLEITRIKPTRAPFECDRGSQELPAYELSVTGLHEPCIVLDPSVSLWWPPPGQEHPLNRSIGRATIAADDRTLQFPAFGGALTEFHRAEFIEHESYVVGRAITTTKELAPGTALHAIGISKKVSGQLRTPLAGRVLLHPQGTPIQVVAT